MIEPMKSLRPHRLALVLLILTALAQPALAGTPRILLAGDSWAWFMFLNRSFETALAERGLDDVEVSAFYTTVPGSTAHDWTSKRHLTQVRKVLEENPTIDIVHLSLGGNDFLNNWSPDMPVAERDQLFDQVIADLEVVCKAILDVRPHLHVVIVEYDYINKSKRGGTLQDLNRTGQILARMKLDLARRLDRVEYIQTYGLMQYHFGVEGALDPESVPLPGNAPDYEPWPGGDADFGNSPEAMMDNIHLSPAVYKYLAGYCIDTLYGKWLARESSGLVASAGNAEDK
ncbi:MAG: SGNH/GDSL hydrolase family protein [Candidatus Hydrogenedentes bacterium]|nr:SGNH/GDSL hydrolase family protein [Candidatus Hydrogenedentota bacterium]